MVSPVSHSVLDGFHAPVREWFSAHFPQPTKPQKLGWPHLLKGESTLILAPTGSGKTLTAFLHCIDRLMFSAAPAKTERCRVLYISPIKALAVDVERNLREPIAGIAEIAQAQGVSFVLPEVVIRSGDTPQKERARFLRHSADILITTPESLYLMLTSNARESLRGIETVILDEIHVLVPSKRGAHLAVSLERLQRLVAKPIQRIGLSATQRPLEEVARYLAGADVSGGVRTSRPVQVIDAAGPKSLLLQVETPAEEWATPTAERTETRKRTRGKIPQPGVWQAIHPRILELIKAHRSTLLFVNNRRSAERLAGALNELAGENLVAAHHGSLAKDQRALIEARLKAGTLAGLVATSSLELGIDMGAIDLVIQVEAPPSVASGLQRIGRAGHQVGAQSEGIILPKYRGDLVACAALTAAMHEGQVEATHIPRNPLDILAQQLVATVSVESWTVDALFDLMKGCASFQELTRAQFESVLDMLSGHYPSDEFADLRPRITWNRESNLLVAREGAKRVAIVNGGTIPDRGLYGVFLMGAPPGQARVGELDEEMVFEMKLGEVFVLGASSWRVDEITFDKVMVSPAPGQPGRMPFWRGDQAPRPLEFGQRIGALIRQLKEKSAGVAAEQLIKKHGLSERAASSLLQYLADQSAVSAVPDDRTIVIERGRDATGDLRICLMSPLGGQILAPWSMAVAAKIKRTYDFDVETMWTNDGFIIRFPDTDIEPSLALLIPGPDEIEALVVEQLSATQLFAARFREIASRALLLPKRRPGQRTPLWQLRKKSQDLLRVASQFPSFPMILEAYRECLAEVFDMPALIKTMRSIETRDITVTENTVAVPSPFASTLLFGYVANYIYDGDAPLAERRAQALTIDAGHLKELLGEGELRELLDAEAISAVEAILQFTGTWKLKSPDALHDLLLKLGDLSEIEISQRGIPELTAVWVASLIDQQRVISVPIGSEQRIVPVEYAARYRDALGVTLPSSVPAVFLKPADDALADLTLRYARTHGPFSATDVAARYSLPVRSLETVLQKLTSKGHLVEGAFRPTGSEREWCDPSTLRDIRSRSLAKLRKAIEPVDPALFTRLQTSWQGVSKKRVGLDALLDVIEKLQGLALPASLLESEILPARINQYLPSDLDALMGAGEVVWVGLESSGEHDGRIALFLTDALPRLYRPQQQKPETFTDKERSLLEVLKNAGASFFSAVHSAVGGGFPGVTLDALWNLVWRGLITNDSFHVMRERTRARATPNRRAAFEQRAFRSRRATPVAAEGRWSLVGPRLLPAISDTEYLAATAQQLLNRYGIVTRDAVNAENFAGGFTALAPIFRTMEESGKLRRGYFVNGVGAMQFAIPPLLEQVRLFRTAPAPDPAEVLVLSSLDPANPYGSVMQWPELDFEIDSTKRMSPMRAVGTHVILRNGNLIAWLARNSKSLICWLGDEVDAPLNAQCVAQELKRLALKAHQTRGPGALVETVNGKSALESPLAEALRLAGFTPTDDGFQLRKVSALLQAIEDKHATKPVTRK